MSESDIIFYCFKSMKIIKYKKIKRDYQWWGEKKTAWKNINLLVVYWMEERERKKRANKMHP